MFTFDSAKLRHPLYAGFFAFALHVVFAYVYHTYMKKTEVVDTNEVYVKPAVIVGIVCGVVMHMSNSKTKTLMSEPYE